MLKRISLVNCPSSLDKLGRTYGAGRFIPFRVAKYHLKLGPVEAFFAYREGLTVHEFD